MVQTQVELTEEQVKALEELARQTRVPLPALIRQGVDQLLASTVAQPLTVAQRQRGLGIVGRFHSGLCDLARRHDEYLAESTGS
ncbi:MAG: ribbon-helix-helix domain-containing protein [Candidatus Latescibacterota bacterium]|jgi:hypothetical protein